MAGLTAGAAVGGQGDGGGAAASTGAASTTTTAADAVRVRLAPQSTVGGEPVFRISRPAPPLRMTNPTTGRGPFGGVAVAPDDAARETDGDGPPVGVRAQRQAEIDGEPVEVELRPLGHGRHVLEAGTDRTPVVLGPPVSLLGGLHRREVIVDGFRFEVDLESERVAALRERATRGRAASAHSGPLDVHAIIPGKVVAVSVAPGDTVTAGQQLLVVEAMKMQNELRSPRDGTIERVGVAPGVNIDVGDLLVVIS